MTLDEIFVLGLITVFFGFIAALSLRSRGPADPTGSADPIRDAKPAAASSDGRDASAVAAASRRPARRKRRG
jgi:hypothetical protein